MEKTHLRDTWCFKRRCSSVKHSNLKSVNQGPNARVWAYTHKYCKPASGTPTLTRDEGSGYAHPPPPDMTLSLMGFSKDHQGLTPWEGPGCTASAGREQLCWVWSATGPRSAGTELPQAQRRCQEQDAKAGRRQEMWDGGRAGMDWMDAASAHSWEGGGNCIIWIEEIRSEGFKWKLFSPVQMSLGTKFSC